MRKALSIIEDTLEQRNLKLNRKKSKVLRIGPGSTIPTTWSPDNKPGEESAIEEASEYKYLGVWFGKGRQHSKHMKHIKRKMSYIVPSIISRAQNAPNRQMAAKALWNSSSRPSLLLGAASIAFTEEITQKINNQQIRLGKWILGLNKSASATITLGMMEWLPVEEEVACTKVKWWRKVLLMPKHRWPRQTLEYMKTNITWNWYQAVQATLIHLGLTVSSLSSNGWKRTITERNEVLFWRKWEEKIGQPAWVYKKLLKEEGAATLIQVAANDRKAVVGDFEGTTCPVCQKDWENWSNHIIWQCETANEQNKWYRAFLSAHKTGTGTNDIILAVRQQDWRSLRWINVIINQWMEARKQSNEAKNNQTDTVVQL